MKSVLRKVLLGAFCFLQLSVYAYRDRPVDDSDYVSPYPIIISIVILAFLGILWLYDKIRGE
jgi:hypothetical protein